MNNRPSTCRTLFYGDFHARIFIIGYSAQGESALVFLQDGEKVFYTIVIDSFFHRSVTGEHVNKTIELLNRFNVEHVSLLCWTHPHHDHSAGLYAIIDQFCDERTRFVYPTHMENNGGDIVDLKEEDREIIRQILEINRKRKMSAIPMDVHDYETRWVDTVRLCDIDGVADGIDIMAYSMSPNSSVLESYVNESKCHPNLLSVSLLIDINNYCLFFGGDLVNSQIERMDQSVLFNCRFVKIPHHGSKTARSLIDYLPSDKFDNACVTTFQSKGLPLDTIIESYKEKCEHLYATADARSDVNPNGFGVVEFDYALLETPPSFSTRLHGDSIVYK